MRCGVCRTWSIDKKFIFPVKRFVVRIESCYEDFIVRFSLLDYTIIVLCSHELAVLEDSPIVVLPLND